MSCLVTSENGTVRPRLIRLSFFFHIVVLNLIRYHINSFIQHKKLFLRHKTRYECTDEQHGTNTQSISVEIRVLGSPNP